MSFLVVLNFSVMTSKFFYTQILVLLRSTSNSIKLIYYSTIIKIRWHNIDTLVYFVPIKNVQQSTFKCNFQYKIHRTIVLKVLKW